MVKVYGADICKDCLAMKLFFEEKGVQYEYVDLTANTKSLRTFLAIRDTIPLYEELRTRGGIGIPLFSKDGNYSFEINDALLWEGKETIPEERYETVAAEMLNRLRAEGRYID